MQPSLSHRVDEIRQRLLQVSSTSPLIDVAAERQGLALAHDRICDVWAALMSRRVVPIILSDDVPHHDPAAVVAKGEAALRPLQQRLVQLAQKVRHERRERGVHTLYIGAGLLNYADNEAAQAHRCAPLVLLACDLVLISTPLGLGLRLRESLDEQCCNEALMRRLWQQARISLPRLQPTQNADLKTYFEAVEQAIATQKHWRLDTCALHLGRFSFAKVVMHHDFAQDRWKQNPWAEHPWLPCLLGAADAPRPQALSLPEKTLRACTVSDADGQVVQADCAQKQVIAATSLGHSLVVEGPPGTGKSQTITNIIARAVHDGKTVLFVAQKWAALDVVHRRLCQVGLGRLCLELHSAAAAPGDVLDDLAQTLAQPPCQDDAAAATQTRDEIQKMDAALLAMHEALAQPIGASGETLHAVLGEQANLLGRGRAPPTLHHPQLEALSRVDIARMEQVLRALGQQITKCGPGPRHPFSGCQHTDLHPAELGRVRLLAQDAHKALGDLQHHLQFVQAALGCASQNETLGGAQQFVTWLAATTPLAIEDTELAGVLLQSACLKQLHATFLAGAVWRKQCNVLRFDPNCDPSKWPIDWLVQSISAADGRLWAQLSATYRAASAQLAKLTDQPLPRALKQRLALALQLQRYAAEFSQWHDHDALCADALGHLWLGPHTSFARYGRVAAWCEDALRGPRSFDAQKLCAAASRPAELEDWKKRATLLMGRANLAHSALGSMLGCAHEAEGWPAAVKRDLTAAGDWCASIAAEAHRYPEWVKLCRLRQKAAGEGLGALAQQLWQGAWTAERAVDELRYAWAEALYRRARAPGGPGAGLEHADIETVVARYQQLHQARLQHNARALQRAARARLPKPGDEGMAQLHHQIHDRCASSSLRQLFAQLGANLQRIKPIVLMGPMSAAQYLAADKHSFDMVVIDEASQLRPEDALGAIARGKQLVVVGDRKQLPPSKFFNADRGQDEDGDDDEQQETPASNQAGNAESILTLCAARGLPVLTLLWHYRSLVPSLMAVSNAELYQHRLVLPPSAYQQDPQYGLMLQQVAGVYDAGGSRTNGIEAAAVVQAIVHHAHHHVHLTLGVVTFSVAQRECILRALNGARAQDTAVRDFLAKGGHQGLFVKNIESVQGDERDVILISVGYGPQTPLGALRSIAFGPINTLGGERRLNVLFTRARVRCVVFCSFDVSELMRQPNLRAGPRLLQKFLQAAARQKLQTPVLRSGAKPALTPWLQDIIRVIASLGFDVETFVGPAALQVPIAVRDPMGPGRHLLAILCDGAQSGGSPDLHQLYCTHPQLLEHMGWRCHRISVLSWFNNRSVQIERLRQALLLALGQTHARQPLAACAAPVVPYVRALPPAPSPCALAEATLAARMDLVRRIVLLEGPIHIDDLARRVGSVFGQKKASKITHGLSLEAMQALQHSNAQMHFAHGFCFTQAQARAPHVRDRSSETGAALRPEAISPMEIRAALALAQKQLGEGPQQDVVQVAARLMGFRRPKDALKATLWQHLHKPAGARPS